MINKTKIAELTKFSVSTVSKAFSNSTDISNTTKEKILKCAVEYGYVFGESSKEPQSKLAAVVEGLDFADTNIFEYQILFGFQLAAKVAGFGVDVINKNASEKWSFTKDIESKGYKGAFLVRVNYTPEITDEIKNSKIPTILFDNYIQGDKTAFVGTDNELGIKMSVDHLVECGHKRIAFFGGNPLAMVSMARKQSFIKSMKENRLVPHPELIFESDFYINQAAVIIPQIIDFGATAIVCASDTLAKYAIEELSKHDLHVPKDISIVGYDNVPFTETITPKLTTINQGDVEIGRSIFYVIKKLLNNIAISKMLFRPSLVIRESTAPPNKEY